MSSRRRTSAWTRGLAAVDDYNSLPAARVIPMTCFVKTVVFALLTAVLSTSALAAEYGCRDGSFPDAVHEGESLRLATLNVAHGRGDGLNQLLIGRRKIERNLDSVAMMLADVAVDVVALQELDVESLWSGNFDHAERLMTQSPQDCAVLGLHAQTWLYRFGTAILSRLQLTDPVVTTFEPTPPTTTKGLVAATLNWRRGDEVVPVRLVSVHLDFSRRSARRRQVGAIIEAAKSSSEPMIVMGDFNEQWHSEDSIVRHLVEEAGLIAFEPESKAHPTYKAKRLDWVLLSEELEFESHQVMEEVVSDHRLVVAQIRWRKEQ
ncbi:hypothetical protein EY643_01045 [Halioglobus maricola]|uniref:Endonuclease/exonuclease/phosphatase domain-containing protein n=1 Tax=Halioglobus maricola TaxID=2601894 RepID=A0A5P9NF07_9GAMM|nr:endonuclease/exonuclease/phosphatase family protein [Halioglobus maricola]QFU74347.1 hypothetical protein EY643_01045 [Halioglobus maricola]